MNLSGMAAGVLTAQRATLGRERQAGGSGNRRGKLASSFPRWRVKLVTYSCRVGRLSFLQLPSILGLGRAQLDSSYPPPIHLDHFESERLHDDAVALPGKSSE